MRSELLIGCGNNRVKKIVHNSFPEWSNLVTLDIDPACNPDVVFDLNNLPLPFADDSFDEAHEYDVIEHHHGPQGNWRGFFDYFSELWRILKPEGLYFCITPDWRSPWAWGDPGHVRVIPQDSLVFLSQALYKEGVGVTPMTDYRGYYKADFEAVSVQCESGQQLKFVLKAHKPARN